MIVILSQESYETTTEDVLAWIRALGGSAVRFNGEDLNGRESYAMHFDGEGVEFRCTLDGREVSSAEVGAVWFRRSHQGAGLDFSELLGDPALGAAMRRYLMREILATQNAMASTLQHASWLTRPAEAVLGKVAALMLARRAGVDIPATLITNDCREIEAFRTRHGTIITKPVGDVDLLVHGDDGYAMYTREVATEDVKRAGRRTIFPSLVQECLRKAFEIRAFYLDGEFYGMAIFSQASARTLTDFRRYDHAHPNRNVPYRLPAEVAARLRRFMDMAGLTTGSVDLVRTPDGRHVFLEVNPGGQFGMLSYPCNYRLEKKVAETLIRRDRNGRE